MHRIRPFFMQAHRVAIDVIDDAMIDGLALRQNVVASLAQRKRRNGLPLRDDERERQVLERARQRAGRWQLDPLDAERLMRATIECAVDKQGRGEVERTGRTVAFSSLRDRLLALLPPPRVLAVPLRLVPDPWQQRFVEMVVERVLQAPLAAGKLDFLVDRRLAIQINDLGIRWVLTVRDGRIHHCGCKAEAEAAVQGNALEFMLLAGRLEDADTLFFQRRLALTGDTELGLTARNLLDQLPWESVPLALRIGLHRLATLASDAREAHGRIRGKPAPRALAQLPPAKA